MRCESVRNAHGRSEILGMIALPSGDIASLGLDGHIKIWNYDSLKLKLKSDFCIPSPYLHSFSLTSKGISVGLANGTLLFLNPQQLKTINKIKLHDDLVTNIIETQNCFVTGSLDGYIIKFNKNTLQVMSKIKTNNPIWKLKLFNQDLYISGDSSSLKIENYMKNQQNLEQLIHKFKGFEEFQGQLFGYNQHIIQSMSSLVEINQGCDYLFKCLDKFLAVKQKQVGIVRPRSSYSQIQWSIIPQLTQGYQIRCSALVDNKLFLSGDSGNIYCINY